MKRCYISYCVCPECKNYIPIPRRVKAAREKGHKKDLYCPWCNKVVTTTEIRYGDAYRNMAGEMI